MHDIRSLINLVEASYRDITETPEFKAWFAGSKIVDEHGQPLRVYHGTTSDISIFGDDEDIPDRGGLIAFFSTSPEFASDYATDHQGANVLPCYLRITNPFDFRRDWRVASHFWDDTGGIYDTYEKNRILMGLGFDVGIDARDTELTEEQFVQAVKAGSWDALEAPEFVHYLREDGFDGIVTLENGAINFGIFEPQQVKSAVGNRSFDPDAEHIGESIAEGIEMVGFAPDSEMEINVASDYDLHEDEVQKIGKVAGLDVVAYRAADGKTSRMFVMDGERPIGHMIITETDLGPGYYQVKSVWVHPDYRSRSIAALLYTNLLDHGVRMVSDTQQSEKGKRLWQQLAQRYRVFRVKSATDMAQAQTPEEIESVYQPDSPYRYLMVTK